MGKTVVQEKVLQQRTMRLSVRIPIDIWHDFAIACKERRVTRESIVEGLVRDWLEGHSAN